MNLVDQMSGDGQMNGVLQNNFAHVVRWSSPVIVNCATAGGAVAAAHDLGTEPTTFRVEPMVSGNAWADSGDRRAWTKTGIVLHFSAVGAYVVFAGEL